MEENIKEEKAGVHPTDLPKVADKGLVKELLSHCKKCPHHHDRECWPEISSILAKFKGAK